MTKQQLRKTVNRLLRGNKAIDGKTAGNIAEAVLADGLISRSEKRFLRGLLKHQRLHQTAYSALEGVLALSRSERPT